MPDDESKVPSPPISRTKADSKEDATAKLSDEGEKKSDESENPSKAALVLAFKEVFNAGTILAALITSEDSRGSTASRSPFTTAGCK